MLEMGKEERIELYKKPEIQAFLSRFLSGEVDTLEPTYDPRTGYSYPTVEKILGDSSKVEPFLDQLYRVEILERKLYDKTIFCPKCGSLSISIHYCCPYCKSFDVQKSSLIEHVKCGYMDVEENFNKGGNTVCPKCHIELKKLDVDYRKAGVWCTCKDCNRSFDIPVASLFCRDCHENFTFEDVLIKDIYSFTVREQAKQEAALGWVLIAPIRESLTAKGFQVEAPAHLKGKSGANHVFDVVAYKGKTGKNITVIDLATSTESAVSEQPVIALFAKIFDVSPDKAYLIAIPKLSENAKRMAELYHIETIEATKQEEVVAALRDKLRDD
jgi:hypothetical protein